MSYSDSDKRTFNLAGAARWFGAEFLVVVTGVLVALALNAWWQGRSDAARERAWLTQLLEDFRANEQEISAVVKQNREIGAWGYRVYRAAHGPYARANPDSLRHWLGNAMVVATPRFRTATWDALIHSGEISLVRDAVVRSHLISFASDLAHASLHHDNLTTASMDHIALIYRRIDPYEIYGDNLRAQGWEELESRFPVQWSALLADEEFVGILYTTATAAEGRARVLEHLQPSVTAVIRLLELKLGT